MQQARHLRLSPAAQPRVLQTTSRPVQNKNEYLPNGSITHRRQQIAPIRLVSSNPALTDSDQSAARYLKSQPSITPSLDGRCGHGCGPSCEALSRVGNKSPPASACSILTGLEGTSKIRVAGRGRNMHLLEMDKPLSIANHPPSRLPGPDLLHLLLQSSPPDGQPAIDFLAQDGTRRTLSYAEFHHASDALATRISAAAGSRADSKSFVVPVLVPQSPELYIALLAILKAGGAFSPLNLDVPVERARFVLEDVSAEVVITTSDLLSRLPRGGHAVLVVDDELACLPVAAEHRKPGPHDLAYVMYTSGSTGTPKGVGVSHEAATQSLLAHDRHIPPFSRFLQFAAPTFDVSVFEIFFPLFRGKTLVGCARPAMLNDLPAVIRTMDVDACELTPSVAGSLLRKRESVPGLRLLLTIGEMLTRPVVEEFGGGGGGRPSMLWGMYGPTEAAIHCTLQPAFASDSSTGHIGFPLDTVSAFVLEIPEEDAKPEFKVLPRGEVGELAVGGYQLAEGYLNRPEQTSSAFIDTPYGRLYRTGDKARMSLDGKLECLGRIADGQVKLRGQRIELGEVEHVALKTDGCHGAVAAVVDSVLVLFCAVDDPGNRVTAIMQSCERWLPGFMLPGDIVVVEAFPRLPSGKVDRRRLVADYQARASQVRQDSVCRDELERQLCDIASQSLGVQVGPGQDLSRAGLDSLGAIKLASVFRDAGFQLGALDVLGARSISALSSRLRAASDAALPDSRPEGVDSLELDVPEIMANSPTLSPYAESIQAIVPCTPLQAAMLVETVANPRAYCNWVELSFRDASHESIRSWFRHLAQANEILRTGFVHHQGQFLQVIFKELGESRILVSESIHREFEMREEQDFLAPFRVQISAPTNDETRVVVQLHHAVYDGWSLDLMLEDVASLACGQVPLVRPQFRETSAYLQSTAFRKSCDAAREFWAGYLLGFQPPSLPVLSSEINCSPEVLSRSITLDTPPQALKTALQRIDCGPQTVFQATLSWLWGAMIGSEDVVVGMVTSGRTVPVAKIEHVIGPCIATVPLRTDLSQVRTIRDLLVSIHAGNRAALPHGVLPLSEIKRAAGIRSGQSIYDVLFVYQETLHGRHSGKVFREVAQRDYLETKLLVEVEPRERDFECRFTYHADVFPEPQIQVMADSVRALVEFIVENVDSAVSRLWRAFPQSLLSVFNPEPRRFTGVPDLAHAVESAAAAFPEKDAVCFAEHISNDSVTSTTITYAELNESASRIAWYISQQGLRVGSVVAIVMEKSVRFYAGVLAILKAGCAYLPLLPSTPVARIDTIVQHARAELCLVDTVTRDKLGKHIACRLLDIQTLDLSTTTGLTTRADPDPDRLAYVIYTSGSTGVPKGVCVTQLNIVSNLDVLSRIYPVHADSRLLQSCSQAFDVSVFEIFFAWTQGMCLCSGTNDTLFEDLERSIRNLGVTHLSMTPTVASLVDPQKVPRVEFLVTAGEAMTEVVAQKWGEKLYQGYGPSETTNICSVKKMGPGQAIQHLGWSFDNTSTFVLARDSMDVVPLGCLGELCFGGDQVARGYINQDDLTSAKFIHHPTFGRIYRSGDLGRMLPDGSMVIVGRADEQIKIRGQRVELGEIDHIIRELSPRILDCSTVLLREQDTGFQSHIVSYLVPRHCEGHHFQVLEVDEELRREIQSLYHGLAARVPAYMVPSAIIPISTLPTTTSGKLDKAQLRQTFKDLRREYLEIVSQGAKQADDDGQWSDVERQIAEAVSTALEVDRSKVRRWTPLTTLGLDSLSAIHVSRQLLEQLGKRFPISLILQNTSVARLAQALPQLEASRRSHEDPTLLPERLVNEVTATLKRHDISFTQILPCTPLQEAMLATSTGKGRYLNRMLFRLQGDADRMRRAWQAMCARHGILRTCFVATDDAQRPILQVVLDRWQPPWHEFDASRSSIDDCILRHVGTVPGALDTLEPAVSFATITGGDGVYLSFVCHHALYDGVAISRLLYEVEQHVSGLSLPPPPIYDQVLRESLALPPSVDSFWTQHLADYEPKLAAHLKYEAQEARSGPLTRELGVPLSDIKARIQDLGVSLLALTQSAWAITLGCLFRTDDVCFGNVVSGRSVPVEGINDLVAPCFNTIPIRMGFSGSQRNIDLMKAFQSLDAELLSYQFTPLRRIQSLFSKHGTWRLFDTLLLLQQPPRPLDQSLWTLERDEGEMDVSGDQIGARAEDAYSCRSRSFVKSRPRRIVTVFSPRFMP